MTTDIPLKKQSLKKDAAYVYAGYSLRYLSLLILIPYYSRVLGPESYGQVLAAMSLMAIIWMIVNFGFSPVGSRNLAASEDRADIDSIFSKHITARLILVPIGTAIGLIGTMVSPIFSEAPMFGVMATILGLLNAFNLGWFYQGLRKFKLSILVEALAYPLNVIFVLLLVRSSDDGIFALYALTASSVICTALSYAIRMRYASLIKQSFSSAIKQIKDSSILFLQGVNTTIMGAGSTYLLSLLSTVEQVGYFGAAERIVAVSLAFLRPASQVLMPTIANRAKYDPDNVDSLVKKGMALELGYGFCVLLGGLVLAPYILPFILGQDFVPSVLLFQILACLFPFAAFRHAFGFYVLIPQKKEKWLLYACIMGNVINLIVAVVAATYYGAIGMAMARVISEIIITIFLLIAAFRLNLLSSIYKDIGITLLACFNVKRRHR
jgi:PST family polysaccharide transporter